MTREQAKKNLIGLGVIEPTEEQISTYLNTVNGEVQVEKNKAISDKAEIERLKKIEEDHILLVGSNQTAEEKLQTALNEAEQTKTEFAKMTNRLEVEKILVGSGLTEEDYKDLIDGIVSENAETSKALAANLTAMLAKQKESVSAKVREELLDETGNPGASGAGTVSNIKKTDAEKTAETIGKSMSQSNESTKSVVDKYL